MDKDMLQKEAALKASSFDDLVKKIENLQHQGKVFKGSGSAEDLARKIMYEKGGSGSLILDSANGLLNAVSGKKRLGDRVQKQFSNLQRKLTDVDIKAGNKIQSGLDKTKATKKIGKAFTYKHDIPLTQSADGIPDEILQMSVPSLTAPLEKAKKAALPMAGAVYLNSKLNDAVQAQNQNKGGDKNMAKVSEEEYRQQLMTKIAVALGESNVEKIPVGQKSGEAELLKKASYALKCAAQKQREMESYLVKLAEENKHLNDENQMMKKAEEAKGVVNMMVDKGMIRRADKIQKVAELLEMEDSSFTMFREAIQNVQAEEKIAGGIDDLTFLSGHSSIKEEKKTLADAFETD